MEYIIDITEAEYEDTTNTRDGKHPQHSAFEYRSMKTVLTTHSMGAVWFKYDIAPLKVHYAMYRQSWADFFVHVSSIIGGTFAAAGVIESLLHNGLCMVAPS